MRRTALALVATLALAAGCKRTAAPPPAHVCERAADGFAGVRVSGAWNEDLGCVWQTYTLDGKRHMLFDAGVLLAREGWANADADARAALAQRYVAGVMLEAGTLVETPPPELADKLAPPSVSAAPDGGVQLVAWRHLPALLGRGTRYGRLEATFRADGNLRSSRIASVVNAR
jgi:hypothetical protein